MKTAIIVSGVVRHMVESSNTWKFDGDYFLIADEYIYKRRSIRPINHFKNQFSEIISNVNVDFSGILIPSRRNVNLEHIFFYGIIINMLWKWKCAYYLTLPYHDINNYDKFIIIRPDIYINKSTNYEYIQNFPLNDDTIYTSSFPHLENVNDRNLIWVNDIFLVFNRKTFQTISKLFDIYVENYSDDRFSNVHLFLGEILKELKITVDGEFKNHVDFVILNDNICDKLFDDGVLKKGLTYLDIITESNRGIL
jgi:hypothetical protein